MSFERIMLYFLYTPYSIYFRLLGCRVPNLLLLRGAVLCLRVMVVMVIQPRELNCIGSTVRIIMHVQTLSIWMEVQHRAFFRPFNPKNGHTPNFTLTFLPRSLSFS